MLQAQNRLRKQVIWTRNRDECRPTGLTCFQQLIKKAAAQGHRCHEIKVRYPGFYVFLLSVEAVQAQKKSELGKG